MIIIDYTKKHHQKIIHACVAALRQGKVVAYPTDTCYGLAVDTENLTAIKKLYQVKGRSFKKAVSIIPSSISAVKKIVIWNSLAEKLAEKFFPGALTIVSSIKYQVSRKGNIKLLSAGTGELGIRQPKNSIALDLAKYLKSPITTTSANISGQPECYSVEDLLKQFNKTKFKPDIIINSGQLAKRKPSTLIKIENNQIKFLRPGPISEKQIKKLLGVSL
ncbi:MAG: L-threonylcarbamoyladenylate synthase [Candidatus Doudnabacteria bacterium]|jgi:L-threonylcarbamoyladenylate synthase